MRILGNRQFIVHSRGRSIRGEYLVRFYVWMARAVVTVMLLSTGVRAEYKPVDISDITGGQRKALTELWAELKRMPPLTREAFICEQLGLFFCKDFSQASSLFGGYPGTTNKDKACFVGKGGKVTLFWDAVNAARARWGRCYYAIRQFKSEASLVPFKKEIQKISLNTARHLLKSMPKEHRWLILALMGDMVYNEQGTFKPRRIRGMMENGIMTQTPLNEGNGCVFLDPEGKEHDICTLLSTNNTDWRWRQVVWRCENLVGAKDILALFPEEVQAMRACYKSRIAKVKDEIKARSDTLLTAADDAMSTLPKDKRLARIALAMGLYYVDHREAGYTSGYLNPRTTVILPDGSKHSGQDLANENPELLQQVPHEAILEYYRSPIEQMARKIAEERFKGMPGTLRDLLRAQLSGELIERDGSPADIQEGACIIQTFDRTWRVPTDTVSHRSTYFKNARGNVISYKIIESNIGYVHTIGLVNLCARILGKAETVNLIPSGDKETQADEVSSTLSKTETVHPTPSGDGETRVDGATSDNSTDEMVDGTEEVPSIQTALGYTTREGADSPPEKVLAHGQTALGKMSAEQRRAWLAESMGFCFTEDGTTAYRSERTANENAVYVDTQGKVRKLSEVTGQNPPGWEAATSAARLSGYNVLTASYREQIRRLAVQTSANILTSMPPELRQSWLAERNRFFFRSSPGNPYRKEERVLESGIKISFQGSDYEHCLYYNPSGKVVSAFDIGKEWNKRWCLLYYCEVVVGINAINEAFRDEVETMHNAFRKSASYQNGTSGSNLSQER